SFLSASKVMCARNSNPRNRKFMPNSLTSTTARKSRMTQMSISRITCGWCVLSENHFQILVSRILLHNLADPAHSLIVLENNVTGRHLRDGTTNLLIDLKKRQLQNEDKLNYELNIGSRKFKCTTIPIVRKEFGI